MKYKNIREEELKNKVAKDWFSDYDTTEILGNIDFTVFPKQDALFGRNTLLWAEAKTGDYDVTTMFVQLILTIWKARTFTKTIPPTYLWAFDFKKIAFIPYIHIEDIFDINDFNWNVTPSNHNTKEFALIKERIEKSLKKDVYNFDYEENEKDLKDFIKKNIAKWSTKNKIKIGKHNFISIYLRWLDHIKPIIDTNWDDLKDANILNSDFYLADLFVDDKGTNRIDDDSSIRDNLFVVFQNQGYKIAKENMSSMFDAIISIRNKDVYQSFWKSYKRPPIKKFRDYIIERRDLIVSQDIRERKWAYFTPRKRVDLSQKYITDYLGENWQDEYYIWDCAAGTGNLLAGLTNKYNIFASTLDQADVNVMHERIEQWSYLLKNHVFQFDFLNDDFTKLPQVLQDIINDPEKRKKLIIYINPPYAESNGRITTDRSNIQNTLIHEKYNSELQKVAPELFAQFLARIYFEIPDCIISQFSTLKMISAKNSKIFRQHFLAKNISSFIVPANTFDNVRWKFPIGFFIWDTKIKKQINSVVSDVYDSNGVFLWEKNFYTYDNHKGRINDWLRIYKVKKTDTYISVLIGDAPDYQNNNFVSIQNNKTKRHGINFLINSSNLLIGSIYFSVRHCMESTWLNDRDQFLYPNDDWKIDKDFQNNCLTFSLFNGQNKVSIQQGINHWIPFSEEEVDAWWRFESNFMKGFIDWKLPVEESNELSLLDDNINKYLYDWKPRKFSKEATEVFDAGRKLWKYYHSQPTADVNAGYYDIRAYFQGRNSSGRMNSKSGDQKYTELIGNLRDKLQTLTQVIKPKVYEYEFLKK